MKTPPTASDRAIDLLKSARTLISDVGWAQGVFKTYVWDSEGEPTVVGYCMMGALNKASADLTVSGSISDAVYLAYLEILQNFAWLTASSYGSGTDMVRWNDSPSRTKEQVLELMGQDAL